MFHFTDDCIIGIEQLDNEHRYLFSLIDKAVLLLHNEYLADRYEKVKELLASWTITPRRTLPMRKLTWSRSVIPS